MTIVPGMLLAAALSWQRLVALSPRGGDERAFAAAVAGAPEFLGNDDPRCRFPARAYLSGTPTSACPALSAWKDDLRATGMALVFAAQFGGNPASYMGHVLLKVLSQEPGPVGRSTVDLMDQTIGFVAMVPEGTGSLAYAAKGLLGGFTGGFVVSPFYETARQYQEIESRDLWEFPLALTPDQLDLMLDLVWELSHEGTFGYRFFSTNCASMIGQMLAIAFPEIAASPGRYLYTTPQDVVGWLAAHRLLGPPHGWASTRAVLRQKLARLDAAEATTLANDLEHGTVAEGQTFAYYDALLANLDFLALTSHDQPPRPPDPRLRHAALRALAHAPAPVEPSPPPPLASTNPALAHPVGMAALGLGRRGASDLLDLEFRPVGHELLDPPDGFSDAMAIAFFDTSARYDAGTKALLLTSFDLLRLRNVVPFSWRDKSFAWTLRGGFQDPEMARFPHGFAGLAGGVGVAAQPASGIRAWLIPGGQLRLGVAPHANADVGPGGEAGLLATLPAELRLEAIASLLIPIDRHGSRQPTETEATAELAATVAAQTSLHLAVSRRSDQGAVEVRGIFERFL